MARNNTQKEIAIESYINEQSHRLACDREKSCACMHIEITRAHLSFIRKGSWDYMSVIEFWYMDTAMSFIAAMPTKQTQQRNQSTEISSNILTSILKRSGVTDTVELLFSTGNSVVVGPLQSFAFGLYSFVNTIKDILLLVVCILVLLFVLRPLILMMKEKVTKTASG